MNMRRYLTIAGLVVLILLCSGPLGWADGDVRRKVISLDGLWQFQVDGARAGDWRPVVLPASFQSHEGTNFHGVGWYRKHIGWPCWLLVSSFLPFFRHRQKSIDQSKEGSVSRRIRALSVSMNISEMFLWLSVQNIFIFLCPPSAIFRLILKVLQTCSFYMHLLSLLLLFRLSSQSPLISMKTKYHHRNHGF